MQVTSITGKSIGLRLEEIRFIVKNIPNILNDDQSFYVYNHGSSSIEVTRIEYERLKNNLSELWK